MSRKLSFIVGGAQKAGTTAMFEMLKDHPALACPNRKELHFFEKPSGWENPTYEGLHDAFAGSGMRFEISPSYLFWPQALERVKTYNPYIKLIFLFRDPIERAFSQWCMSY